MASTVGGPQGQVEQSLQPLFQLTGMMRRLEEKFIQQLDRIAFHHNDTQNDYRVQERRLSGLMLEKTISDEKTPRATLQKILTSRLILIRKASSDHSSSSTMKLPWTWLSFVTCLGLFRRETDNAIKTPSDMERWLDLSRELHLARLGAIKCVSEQGELNTHFFRRSSG